MHRDAENLALKSEAQLLRVRLLIVFTYIGMYYIYIYAYRGRAYVMITNWTNITLG